MELMLMPMMMAVAMMMPWLTHPLSMGFIIITETLMVAAASGLFAKSYLYSYILIIIMMSGMLVLFIYMSSVASNKKFKMSGTLLIYMITIMILVYITSSEDSNMMMSMDINMPEMSMTKLFNNKTKYITAMMMMYLLFTMITVVNIVNIQEGPLRKKS